MRNLLGAVAAVATFLAALEFKDYRASPAGAVEASRPADSNQFQLATTPQLHGVVFTVTDKGVQLQL
jgi:hypothetical protein